MTIGRMEMNRHIAERGAPFDHRGVVVRMRDRDDDQRSVSLHGGDGGLIDERYAVPEDVPGRSADQKRALADAELRLRADADDAGFHFAKDIPEALLSHGCQGGPSLSVMTHVLALVRADWTVL